MSDFDDDDDYGGPDYGDEDDDDMMGGFDMHDASSLPEGITKEVITSAPDGAQS
jgi:hypothetical protein